MKLISCYIAGFGKFVNASFDFHSDLLVIKENNGWGKTTLADFIRCMLYGLDGGRTKSVRSNDRVRYEPWNSATYGGSLTFVYGGRRFRVERTFGKTPAQDSARVFDGNNTPCYDFGDRAERLGIMLFGMDSDSYRRSVYIPQGEIETESLQGDLKTRLLALLNTGGVGENGAERALEKLDAADRALRAKRRPAKGKLDEIDEKLAYISAKKAECENCAAEAARIRGGLSGVDNDVAFYHEQIRKAEEELEYASRQSELAVKRQTYAEAQEQLGAIQAQRQNLDVFFNGIDPATVNLDGIAQGVSQLYDVKNRLAQTQEALNGMETQYQEKTALLSQAEHIGQTIASYDEILGEREKEEKKRGKKLVPKMNKASVLAALGGLILAVIGAVLVDSLLEVGLAMVGIGVLTMLVVFLLLLPRREKVKKEERKKQDKRDEAIAQHRLAAQAEYKGVQAKLSAYPQDLETRYQALVEERSKLQEEWSAREQGVCNFLRNFRFEETYDYRAAVSLLHNRVAAHKQLSEQAAEYQKRLSELAQDVQAPTPNEPPRYASIGELRAQKDALTNQKEDLLSRRARALSEAEDLENRADKSALLAEEEALTAEKERLEKRHRAILRAKELLLRARDNVATRYLIPVEKGCKYYLSVMQDDGANVRFTADGAPLREEKGKLREIGYYSAGMRELLGFCIRIALVDAIFNKEKPVLILDDPFVNLDDEKTDKAKKLVKELTKRYQVLYMTCKKERKL